MWWVHHLSTGSQAKLTSSQEFLLPLMPVEHSPEVLILSNFNGGSATVHR